MTQTEERPAFQQAGIQIEKLDEYEQLHSALNRIFAPAAVEKFLRLLQRKGVPIRDFHRILREKLLEQADATLAKCGNSAQQIYDALTTSDQAQAREFYLTTLEAVDQPLREKFNKLYRYY
jgi:cyclophilin family peptidyl-prolyl cis-trans isomerase